jgi:hypothetical protein
MAQRRARGMSDRTVNVNASHKNKGRRKNHLHGAPISLLSLIP